MRKYVAYGVAVLVFLAFAAGAGMLTGAGAQQPGQPTMQLQSLERALGSLTVQNIACGDQAAALAEELRKAKLELTELKAKAVPTTVDPGPPQ